MSWSEPRVLSEVRGDDLAREGVVFLHDRYRYRTTGSHLSQGGMGSVYHLERLHVDDPPASVEHVVGKIFHAQYLYQLRTDDVTRREHQTTLAALARIVQIDHPHILPTYLSAQIADNYIFVAPTKSETLLEAIARGQLTPRRRVALLIQALRGLQALHNERIIHRDLTLRNILLDRGGHHAYLFDFDLALCLDDVVGVSYKTHYKGRIFGSPGYSVPPEVLDPVLSQAAITPRLDIYAIGGALFTSFTDQLPYGHTEDMWGLLARIAEGVVAGGESRIEYPDVVPPPLRPIIEGCLERDPGNRYGSVGLVIAELEGVLDQLDDAGSPDSKQYSFATSVQQEAEVSHADRIAAVHAQNADRSVTRAVVEIVDNAVHRFGYEIRKSLGRVLGHPIFLAAPDPLLVTQGQFPDANPFPKIITAIDLNRVNDSQAFVDAWFSHYLPILMSVRTGLLTSLYRVILDDKSNNMLIFSEYVDDPRFGTQLADMDLTLRESLGLAFLVIRQVASLHERGLAHNNVRPESLLLKGIKETRSVHPAMVGLIDPSSDPSALVTDVRSLAAMIASWIRPARIEALEPTHRAYIDDYRARLAGAAYQEAQEPPRIDELFGYTANALASIDYNFNILRQNGGDLESYILLLMSQMLYGRLWG